MGGWDYYTFYSQPRFFIEYLAEYIQRERREIKRQQKRNGTNN